MCQPRPFIHFWIGCSWILPSLLHDLLYYSNVITGLRQPAVASLLHFQFGLFFFDNMIWPFGANRGGFLLCCHQLDGQHSEDSLIFCCIFIPTSLSAPTAELIKASAASVCTALLFFFYMCIFNTHIHCDLCSSSRQPLDLSQSHFGANRTEPTNRCFWLPVSEGGSISAAELLITAQPATAYIHVNNQGVVCFAVRPAGSHILLGLPSEVPQQDPAAAVALLNQILFFSFFRFFSNIIDKPAATVAFKGGNRG